MLNPPFQWKMHLNHAIDELNRNGLSAK